MARSEFTSFAAIADAARSRDLVLWGAGNIADKTLRRIARVDGLVDNNPNLQGQTQGGRTIGKPAGLEGLTPRPFVVICTTSFREVSRQLAGYGYVPGRDFAVSPILNDLMIIDALESLDQTVLFTSGLPPQDDPEGGGGLYELVIEGPRHRFRKVFSGNFHGLRREGETFLAVEDERGLVRFTSDYEIVETLTLPEGARAHGVSWSEDGARLFVACSYLDAVLVLDRSGRELERIAVSGKRARSGSAQHHVNDLLVIGDSLYLSMFSLTGNWKRDVFDGGVLEYDLAGGAWIGAPVRDLWMPHSVEFVDGSLVVLDSLRGELRKNNARPTGRFPGFARGLAHDGARFFVGQSRNRNFSAVLGDSLNVAIDTLITVFDEHTKVSKSFALPSTVSEIHAIALNGPARR